jgi:hypothetical protein
VRDASPVHLRTFAIGQYVELINQFMTYDEDLEGGTRGIVRAKRTTEGPDGPEPEYLVAFLRSERLTGNEAWVPPMNLLAA